MKKIFLIAIFGYFITACQSDMKYKSVDDYPVYNGDDLGFSLKNGEVTFKLWSPEAEAVKLHIYETGHNDDRLETKSLMRTQNGVWALSLDRAQVFEKYYTYQIQWKGKWLEEKPDPYAVAVGANGLRSMVLDLNKTDPEGWSKDKRPELKTFNDIIVYEMHIRDLTIHESSGIDNKGKYLGLTEKGSKSPQNLSTALDHIKELGVTHVHLLPTFDHRSIDETKLDEPQYNWGYDPLNYNVPEGSFSTDPYDGRMRIKEFKQMIQAFHNEGIRVILDVVYNHTGQTENSNFNQLVPDYYYRKTALGEFSDAAACGNETASEREMMRNYMLNSVKYWIEEYHMDGFRFDLMGIHDIETMNAISALAKSIDPSIFIYGEGWKAGDSPLPDAELALKVNTPKLENVAAFTDDLRDGLKGSVFREEERGFVSGEKGLKESIKFGIVASTKHPQVDYNLVNYSDKPWALSPSQTISYVSCHDNHTLFDKLQISMPNASEEALSRMHRLAETIVLTSQGVSFIHAGMEILRTKNGIENSYNSPDSINQIDWSRKSEFKDEFEYYKSLIALRKSHPAFRMNTTNEIQKHLEFLDTPTENSIAYLLKDNANGDNWKNILVLLNGGERNKSLSLPMGNWTLISDMKTVDENGIGKVRRNSISLPAQTAFILKQD